MSHFAVLVIGDNHEELLAPFHEFECTGNNDQYVQEFDKTEEVRKEYNSETLSMLKRVSDGKLFDRYDDQFHREPTAEELKAAGIGNTGMLLGTGCSRLPDGTSFSYTSQDWGDGRGHRGKVHFIPEGYEEVDVPMSEAKTFAEWCEYSHGWEPVKHGEEPDLDDTHKYGYAQLDEKDEIVKCVDRTNPKAQWDWYVVGGRYRGWFPLKDGVEYSRDNLGKPGTFERMTMREGKPEYEDYDGLRKVDQAKISDIDFERGRDLDEKKARESFGKWRAIFEKHGKPEPWSVFREKSDQADEEINATDLDDKEKGKRKRLAMDKAREDYNRQPAIQEARTLCWGCPVAWYGFDEEEYAQKMRRRAMIPYAIVKDGKWYGKGEMGWWGMSSGDKDQEKWNEEIQRLFDDLPPDTQLTLVDCHI